MAIKCPNCGNLNPDDYAYCDECGARLEPVAAGTMSGDVQAAAMPGDSSAPDITPTQTMPAVSAPTSASDPGLGSSTPDAAPSDAATGTGTIHCPHCGTVNMAGAAFCDECGMSLSGPVEGAAAVPAVPVASDGGTPDMEAPLSTPDATQAGSEPYSEPPLLVTPSMGMSDSGSTMISGTTLPPPVTEDTIAPTFAPEAPEAPTPADTAAPPSFVTPPPPINLTAPEAPPPAPSQPSVLEMPVTSATQTAQTCTNCGEPLAPGARFCPNCGTLVAPPEPPPPPQPRICPNCGSTVAPGARFCENCGQRMDAAPAAGAAPVAPAAPSAPPPMAAQPPVAPPVPAAPPPAPANVGTGPILATPSNLTSGGPPRLEIAGTGAVINLPDKDELLVGREDPLSEPPIFPDVDLTPYGGEEGGVSRRHARIFRQNGQYFLEDLHSTNYTKLDGMKLAPRSPQPLQSGARIDFGKVSLFFRA